MSTHRILYAASEAAPLVKTGGLADVAGSLPAALRDEGCDVRVVLPAYSCILDRPGRLTMVARARLGPGTVVRILEGTFPDTNLTMWLVDAPSLFDREGGPYIGPNGTDWPDNPERFATFSRAVELLAMDALGLSWRPTVVHCNDWQTALVPALLAQHEKRPATVFTIHNLAYQGLYPRAVYTRLRTTLRLPEDLFQMHGLEFHGQLSFIKGGLVYADMLSTVSPTYAEEIRSARFGYGLEGLLQHRHDQLWGILNGMDDGVWDPSRDPFLTRTFSADNLASKAANKITVQERFGLPVRDDLPLVGVIGRLVEQKGGDLVLQALAALMDRENFQLVALGSGDPRFETAFRATASRHPDRVAVQIGFSEELAHLIEGGADIFLMPSRFEPCGLNQMYSLRYGTVPVVHGTGGLADTVVDACEENFAAGTANGFVFREANASALSDAFARALALYRDRPRWEQLMRNGMAEDFSWQRSARAYCDLYKEARRLHRASKKAVP
jgi:starch synthase